MDYDVIRHVVEDVFAGQIATPAEWSDSLEDDFLRYGVTADCIPYEVSREK